MANNLVYRYGKTNVIIKQKFEGKFSKGELFQRWSELFNNRILKKSNYHLLFDYYDAEIDFNSEDFNQFSELLKSNDTYIQKRKIVVIATKPLISCFFHLIEEKVYSNSNCCLKMFQNEQDAMNWLFEKN